MGEEGPASGPAEHAGLSALPQPSRPVPPETESQVSFPLPGVSAVMPRPCMGPVHLSSPAGTLPLQPLLQGPSRQLLLPQRHSLSPFGLEPAWLLVLCGVRSTVPNATVPSLWLCLLVWPLSHHLPLTCPT